MDQIVCQKEDRIGERKFAAGKILKHKGAGERGTTVRANRKTTDKYLIKDVFIVEKASHTREEDG